MNEMLLHMTDLFLIPDYPNPFAYNTRFSNLHQIGQEKVFVDSKGEWKISGLAPKDLGWMGEKQVPRYDLFLKLQNNQHPTLQYSHVVYVTVWETDQLKDLKRMIKAHTGYTPQPKTLRAIYELTQEMISAWKEQDLWYAMQDKTLARKKMEELKSFIIQRYQNQEPQREEERNRYRCIPVWLLYLTKTEEQQLKEYQRILNGRVYLDETETYGDCHGTVGLKEFAQEVFMALFKIDEERKRQEDVAHKRQLAHLLEFHPMVRKITSHYIQAKKEAKLYGVKQVEIQFIHRLYGYTTDETSYYEKYRQFTDEYLKPFGISMWDLSYLARKAEQQGEFLPPAQTNYQRQKPFYYGDQILREGKPKMVKKVGVKYVYVEDETNGVLIQKATPYQANRPKRKIG